MSRETQALAANFELLLKSLGSDPRRAGSQGECCIGAGIAGSPEGQHVTPVSPQAGDQAIAVRSDLESEQNYLLGRKPQTVNLGDSKQPRRLTPSAEMPTDPSSFSQHEAAHEDFLMNAFGRCDGE